MTHVKEEKNSDCASETGKDEGKAVCASETGDNGNNAKRAWEAEKDGKREGDTVKTGKAGNTEENGAAAIQDGSKDKNSAIAAFAAEGLKEKENAESASCGVVEGGAENTREGVAEDEEKEKESVFKTSFPKAYAFWTKYWGLFLAPIIAFVIYFVQLAVSEVYPFGSNYVVASYDLSAQICPFIEHLFDVMDGKSSLFYSYAIAGGADVFGTFAYFFISPFSFIYLLFGDGNVYNACGVVMAFKLAAIAFAGAWFVKKLFKEIPDYLGVGIGIVYAFCGYVFVASTYVNWIDFLIYMPFCAAAFVHFVRTKKFLPFSILMACCIYTCFSIACFSMLIVFPTLIAYAFICVKREERNSFIAYLCLAFVVAILIALPVLAAASISPAGAMPRAVPPGAVSTPRSSRFMI
ncbi:MAG: YfhO family protein [Firmicutes bacterium]|nr:YfhO family protein [Bacillota bacterium]